VRIVSLVAPDLSYVKSPIWAGGSLVVRKTCTLIADVVITLTRLIYLSLVFLVSHLAFIAVVLIIFVVN
jgi:hypothetical protein